MVEKNTLSVTAYDYSIITFKSQIHNGYKGKDTLKQRGAALNNFPIGRFYTLYYKVVRRSVRRQFNIIFDCVSTSV